MQTSNTPTMNVRMRTILRKLFIIVQNVIATCFAFLIIMSCSMKNRYRYRYHLPYRKAQSNKYPDPHYESEKERLIAVLTNQAQ